MTQPRPPAPLIQPAAPTQQMLWFLDQLHPGEAMNNLSVVLPGRGPLDEAALHRALAGLVERHEALRTTFRSEEDVLLQVVAPEAREVPLETIDLRGLAPQERAATLDRLQQEIATAPFDLTRAPLLRGRLVHLAPDEHVLVLVMHHIVSDAASMEVLTDDLAALYEAALAGRPADLPPLRIQYVDFTAWQAKRMAGPDAQAAVDWWREQLTGLPVLDLMPGRPRPASFLVAGGQHVEQWEPKLVAPLVALARAEGATLYMVTLAGFAALLDRYAGAGTVAIGSPVSGRANEELQRVVGLFVTMLVLRVDTSGDPTFRELLRRARRTVLDVLAHQHVPFDRVTQAVRSERAANETQIFQAMLNHVRFREETDARTGLWSAGPELFNGTARFDIDVTLVERPGSCEVRVEWRRDLLPDEVAIGMLGQLRTLLSGALAQPDVPLSRLPLLGTEEAAAVLARQDGGPPVADGGTLDALLRDQARVTPDAPALRADGRALSYQELEAQADRLAAELLARGVAPGDPVGLWVRDQAEAVVGLLAVASAGCACLPLDPAAGWPEDADQRWALASPDLARQLPAGMVTVLAVPDPWAPPAPDAEWAGGRPRPEGVAVAVRRGEGRVGAGARPEGVAVAVAQDEGRTADGVGWPRDRVALEHRQLVAAARALVERLAVTPGAAHAVAHPPTSEAFVTALATSLLTGGCLQTAVHAASGRTPEPERRPARRGPMHDSDAARPPDYRWLTPPAFANRQAGGEDGWLPRRALVLSGVPMARDWPRELEVLAAAGCSVFVRCGPPESAGSALGGHLGGAVDPAASSTPLGRPLPGARLAVLDATSAGVPLGMAGTLHVGGPLLRRGAGTVRSGERVRVLPDGTFEYVGAAEHPLVVRGERVEPVTVEAALAEHPGVVAAVLDLRDGRLVAYAVPRPGARLDAEQLRAQLAARLPAPHVPAAIVVLDRLPLRRQGTLDRAALPDPPPSAESAGSGRAVAPRSPMERALARVWAEVLGHEQVGVTDSFFALGGDSIRSIQVVAKAAEQGLTLSAADLFIHQTIAELADVVAAPGGTGDAVALTPAQRRRLAARPRHQAVLDPEWPDVEDGLARLAARHDALRLRVEEEDGLAVQRVGEEPAAVWREADGGGVRLVGDAVLLDGWSWSRLLAELRDPGVGDDPSALPLLRRVPGGPDEPALHPGPSHARNVAVELDVAVAWDALGALPVDLVVAALASAWPVPGRLVVEVGDAERVTSADQSADRPLGRLARDVRCVLEARAQPDEAALRAAKEALRAATADGAGRMEAPQVAVEVVPPLPAGVREVDDAAGPLVAPLDVRARTLPGGLDMTLRGAEGSWSPAALGRLTEEVAAALRALVAACGVRGARAYTPSDFPEAGLSQEQLDRLVARLAGGAGGTGA